MEPGDPRNRLMDLVAAQGVSLSGLSALLSFVTLTVMLMGR